jgi:hypothetical protein
MGLISIKPVAYGFINDIYISHVYPTNMSRKNENNCKAFKKFGTSTTMGIPFFEMLHE